jgi:hypothetical protein
MIYDKYRGKNTGPQCVKREVSKGQFTLPCHAQAVPVPFPCLAMPLRVYIVFSPYDLHGAAMFDPHVPCHDHAVLKATYQGYSTAWHGHSMGMAWHV